MVEMIGRKGTSKNKISRQGIKIWSTDSKQAPTDIYMSVGQVDGGENKNLSLPVCEEMNHITFECRSLLTRCCCRSLSMTTDCVESLNTPRIKGVGVVLIEQPKWLD